MHPLKL